MDYKIVLMKGAEEDFDRFIAYLLIEKKTEQVARHLLNDFEALNCKMKLELRNWDKGACPFIPIRAVVGPLFSIFV